MSTKVTNEPECKSVLTTELAESSGSSENMIKLSDKFFQIFKLSYTFYNDQSKLNRKQIKTIEPKMQKLFYKVIKSKDTKLDDVISLAYAYNHMGNANIKTKKNENLFSAKDLIQHCLYLIKDIELDHKVILLVMIAHSHLGYIYCKLQKTEKVIEIYDKAIQLYLEYIKKNESKNIPVDYDDIFIKQPKLDGFMKLNFVYTSILSLLMNVHTTNSVKPTNLQSFMQCSHLILIDEFNKLQKLKESKWIKSKQWIDKATELCGYLIMCNRFKEARSHIAVAIIVENFYLTKYLDINTRQEFSSEKSELHELCLAAYQSINFCHVQYSLALMCRSAERLLRLEKDEKFEDVNSIAESPSKSKNQASYRPLLFDHTMIKNISMNLHYIIQTKYISNYIDVQQIFTHVLTMLHDSMLNFHPNKDIKAYMKYVLSTSNAYKYMALYEKDTVSRFLLQERRVEVLRNAANLVSENNRIEKKYLHLQLAIGYSTLINMKLEDLEVTPYLPRMSHKHDEIIIKMNVLLAKGLLSLRNNLKYI